MPHTNNHIMPAPDGSVDTSVIAEGGPPYTIAIMIKVTKGCLTNLEINNAGNDCFGIPADGVVRAGQVVMCNHPDFESEMGAAYKATYYDCGDRDAQGNPINCEFTVVTFAGSP